MNSRTRGVQARGSLILPRPIASEKTRESGTGAPRRRTSFKRSFGATGSLKRRRQRRGHANAFGTISGGPTRRS